MRMTDEEVVKEVRDGDKERYGEIVRRYENKLFWYVKRLVNQGDEEVEDLLQEVFVNAYINLNSFDARRRFGSWIYRMAHNKVVDYFRKRRLKTTSIDDKDELIISKTKLMEELAVDKERDMEIRQALRKLEVKYQEVLILYYFEEKNYDEISDILRIPVNYVGVLLNRAKAKLRERIMIQDPPAGRAGSRFKKYE